MAKNLLAVFAALIPVFCALADEASVQIDRLPPALWCDNTVIAEKRGVTEQCSKYRTASAGKKFRLTLLFESYCPDCQRYISGSFYNDIYKKFSDHVEFELVAFGNANISESGKLQCQHGEKECKANMHEACAVHFLQDPLPYIHCLEIKLAMENTLEKASRSCADKIKLSHQIYDQILHCAVGKKGMELQKEVAARTASAWPDKVQQQFSGI